MAKQNWNPGSFVTVGFLRLLVVEKIATPGNYLPDQYVLTNLQTNRWYRFVPHNGLTRCDSLNEARQWA